MFHLLDLMSWWCSKCWCCWLGTSCLVSADLILQTLRRTDLPHTSPVKQIQLFLLFSYVLFRVKPTNRKAMWVLKDATWWVLWKYTSRLDESAEIIYLAPWLIIYLKLNPCISSLHNLRALDWRSSMDHACNFDVGPPFLALSGFLWVSGWTAKVIAYQ